MTAKARVYRSAAIGPSIMWASVGVALVLWLLAAPLSSRTESPAAIWKSLANIAAFSGTVLYSWSLVLSARWLWTDRWFGGLDKVYKQHHIAGGLSFFLLTLHPLFLTARLMDLAPERMIHLWWLGSNWQLNFGIIALYAISVVLPLTVFLRLRYQMFIWVHGVLGGVFFLGFLHAFMANGNMMRFWPLWLYMATVTVAAMYAFLYHTVFGLFLPARYRYEVSAVKQLGRDTVEIILEPKGRMMNFIPGQFSYVSFHGRPVADESHPYSMASSPRQRQVRFVVKVLGDYTASLLALTPKTEALIEGPHGGFSFKHSRSRKQVWIAGGIGVTPFLAMAQSLRRGYEVDFYYCVQNMGEAHFDAEFRAIAKKLPTFRVHTFCQDKQGFIGADFLAKDCGLHSKEIFICGPPPMMKALEAGLEKQGIREELIHYEDFSFK